MSLFWWRREQQRKKAARNSPARPRRKSKWQPNLEALEDRVTPATHIWVGGDVVDPTSWKIADNWVGNNMPQPPNAEVGPLVLVFPAGGFAQSHNDIPQTLTVGEIDITGTPAGATSYTIDGNAINLGDGGINAGHIEDIAGANPNDVINFAGIALAASKPEVLPPNPGAFFTGHDISKDGPGSLFIKSPMTGAKANLTINFAPVTAVTPSAGDGEVILTAANSYGGTTAVGGGVLSLSNDLALGAADGTPGTGTFLVSPALGGTGGNIELNGVNGITPVHVGNEYLDMASTGAQSELPTSFHPTAPSNRQFDNDTNGDSWSGPIVLDTPLTVGGTTVTTFYTVTGTSLTLTGPIIGALGHPLVKDGNGTLILAGNDTLGSQGNTYAGQTIVNHGTLVVAKSTALGAEGSPGSGSDTVLNNNAKLEFNADLASPPGTPIAIGDEGVTVNGTPGVRIEDVSTGGVTNSLAGDVVLNTPTTVRVDTLGNTLALNGVISGTGAGTTTVATLTKDGAGTLSLGGPLPNTYTFGTAVNQGILVGAKTNAFGPQFTVGFPFFIENEVNVNNHAVLAFSGGTPLVHHVIPNDIDINSDGADNPNGPTGSPITMNGTPPIAGSALWNQSGFTDLGTTADSADLSLGQDTSIRSDAGNLTILDSIISIAGMPSDGEEPPPFVPLPVAVSKDGPGKVTFAGNNTYGGNTYVNEGELDLSSVFGDHSIPADLIIGPNLGGTAPIGTARLTNAFNQFATMDAAGNITAVTTIFPDGLLVIGGAPIGPIVMHSGTIQVLAGETLTMSGPGGADLTQDDFIPGVGSVIEGNSGLSFIDLNGKDREFIVNGTLVVDPTIEELLAVPAGLIKSGDGTMTMNADNTYDGLTDIEMGTLFINGDNSQSSVNIAAGATLAGTGKTGPIGTNLGTNNLGDISPAGLNATGTLTDAGDVNFGPGSTFTVDVNSPSDHDLLAVQGNADLTNGKLIVNSGPFNAPIGTHITIMTINGTRTGEFLDTNITNPAFQVVYNAHSVELVVVATTATLTVTASPTTAVIGQQVTLTATVTAPAGSPATPTGTITFRDGVNGPSLGTVALSPTGAGTADAILKLTTLSLGSHTIQADYSGDSVFGAKTAFTTVDVTVGQGSTTTTLQAVPSTTTAGNTSALTATVAVVAPAVGTPTGTVTFTDVFTPAGSTTANPAVLVGTAPVANGVASLPTGPLAAGSHVFTAAYSGDTNFKTSSGNATVTVNASNTTTTLNVVPTTLTVGTQVTMSAGVTGSSAFPPHGTVTFKDGTTTLAVINLSAGTAAVFTTSSLAPGTHTITAVFTPDATDINNLGSTSTPVTVTVNPNTTTTSLSVVPSSVVLGGLVTATAQVHGGTGNFAPTGTVTFKDGSTTLGTQPLVGGVATFTTTSLALGSHSITATYNGDVNNSPSTSSAQTVVVTPPVPETIPGINVPVNANISNLFQFLRNKIRHRAAHNDFVVPITLHNISGVIVTGARMFLLGLPKGTQVEFPTFTGFSKGVPGVPDATPFVSFNGVINAGHTVFLHIKAPSNLTVNQQAKLVQSFGIELLAGA
jgi:autotransporter-associated beta strand protein